MNRIALLLIPLVVATFPPLASADGQSVYKWTDADGVLHYSDKPPKESVADLETMDLPALPPQDTAKIAADQAALAASTAALVQQQQAEEALRQREEELALERAQLEASQQALQQTTTAPEPVPVYPIYATSGFIPRSYRRNLYGPHHFEAHRPMPAVHPVPVLSRPAIAVTQKP